MASACAERLCRPPLSRVTVVNLVLTPRMGETYPRYVPLHNISAHAAFPPLITAVC